VDILLNGAQKTIAITSSNDLATGHNTDLAFDVMVGDGRNNKSFSTTDRRDAVTVTVTRMDMLNFEATFSGTMTEMGVMRSSGREPSKVSVSGTISLHRASAPAPINAGNWVDCDPIVHDWLNEAQNRASSDCEVKFDHHLETALSFAFAPMESALEASQWQIVNMSDPSGLFDSAPRGSEGEPFRGQGFKLTMAVNPNTAQGQQVMAANTPDPLMDKMIQLLKAGNYAEAQVVQKQLDAKLKSAPAPPSTRLTVQVSFNFSSREFINFHGAFSTSALPGGGTVLYLPAMQGLGGGSGGDPGTWVLLGPWSRNQGADESLDAATVNTKHLGVSQLRPGSGYKGDRGDQLEPASGVGCAVGRCCVAGSGKWGALFLLLGHGAVDIRCEVCAFPPIRKGRGRMGHPPNLFRRPAHRDKAAMNGAQSLIAR
jgi:hypothetical protein